MAEPIARPRVVLVTGGAQGIGAAVVRRFAEAGDHVVIADTDGDRGAELAGATGSLFLRTDVARPDDNRDAVAAAVERFGGLDVVCLNAGVPGGISLGDDFDPERYRQAMSVNLDGVVYGANAALPHLRAQGGGAIVITSSLAGLAPSPDMYYSAAKHALIGLTRSLALHTHPDNITVNAVCPGFVDTRLVVSHRDAVAALGLAVAHPDRVA
ncbi:dehydrogenase [Streptomyces albospinus]|uniref:Dehydrogenase n=1 Tax=Streptomyces albospinus TaxID=285515 RepID=A0ABQ2V089_9ACTN|nr:SDR family oxidoreductase [Streptomyces albospinus]GGU61015.1 dehydrogenase [Streptomyces albospinus]